MPPSTCVCQWLALRTSTETALILTGEPVKTILLLLQTDRPRVACVAQSVTLFYRETCAECVRARDTLARLTAERSIPFTAKEVSSNVDNRDLLILTSGQIGTPVVLVDKREVIGLDRSRLQRLLGVDVGLDHPAHW